MIETLEWYGVMPFNVIMIMLLLVMFSFVWCFWDIIMGKLVSMWNKFNKWRHKNMNENNKRHKSEHFYLIKIKKYKAELYLGLAILSLFYAFLLFYNFVLGIIIGGMISGIVYLVEGSHKQDLYNLKLTLLQHGNKKTKSKIRKD